MFRRTKFFFFFLKTLLKYVGIVITSTSHKSLLISIVEKKIEKDCLLKISLISYTKVTLNENDSLDSN